MRCSCDLEHLNTKDSSGAIGAIAYNLSAVFNIQIGRLITQINSNTGDSKRAKNPELSPSSNALMYTHHLPLEQVRVQIFPP